MLVISGENLFLLLIHLSLQDLSAWCITFLKYVQVLRSLEEAHAHMVQPQKRKDIRRALDCCMGRLLEIRNWMVPF